MNTSTFRAWLMKVLNDRTTIFSLIVLVATFLASGVSFYATAQGLSRYFETWIAIGMAGAVQLALFGLAWLVGLQRAAGQFRTASLYLVVMTFSVAFSYMFFHSTLGKNIRPAVQARQVSDALEAGIRTELNRVNAAIVHASEAKVRLDSWLDLEDRVGFSMQTCANEPIPYLNEVCARLQQRVAAWETTSGQQYRQGPGQSLIYGSLKQEVDVVVKNVADLESYYHLLKSRPFEAGKTVDARKSIYNQTISNAPVAVLDRYSEAPDGVPEQALLADRADTSGEHEAPFAALVELPKLMTKSSFDELDYITVASFLLALFLDVFVLAVAWGVGHSSLTEGAALLPIKRTLKPEWDRDIVSVVAGWIREATLMPEASVDEQVGFVRAILARIRSEGEASELTAADPLHKRFAEALVRARVATLADQSTEGGVEGPSTYRLKPWISPALVRFMELIRRPQGAAVLA